MPHQQTSGCPEMIDFIAHLSHCHCLTLCCPSFTAKPSLNPVISSFQALFLLQLKSFYRHFLTPTEALSCVLVTSSLPRHASLTCITNEKPSLILWAVVLSKSTHFCIRTYSLLSKSLVRFFHSRKWTLRSSARDDRAGRAILHVEVCPQTFLSTFSFFPHSLFLLLGLSHRCLSITYITLACLTWAVCGASEH